MTGDFLTRREFMRSAAARLAGVAVAPAIVAGCRRGALLTTTAIPPESTRTGWDLVPEILARIAPPKFADREFDITRLGARPDGTDCTAAHYHLARIYLKREDTAEAARALRAYLDESPRGEYAKEAKELLKKIEPGVRQKTL